MREVEAANGCAQVRFYQSSVENALVKQFSKSFDSITCRTRAEGGFFNMKVTKPEIIRENNQILRSLVGENFGSIAPAPAQLQRDPPLAVQLSLLEDAATLTNGNPHVDEALMRVIAPLQSVTMRIPPKLDTRSAANWTRIPAQTGHLFQAKLDTRGVTARGRGLGFTPDEPGLSNRLVFFAGNLLSS